MRTLPALRTRLLGLVTIALIASTATSAAATDVQACLASSEKGQRARANGKLREARESFLVCGNETCPAIVRRDCAQWTSELTTALPTVVFGAKDKAARDLFDVTVSMDGESIVNKLDGKAVFVDPGRHTFKFETAGAPPVTETLLVKEGEKSRVVTVTFAIGESAGGAGGGTVGSGSSGGGSGSSGSSTAGGDRGGDGGHTIFPWIVVGIGGVGVVTGIVLVATTPSRPGNCQESTQTCQRLEGQSEADFKSDQEQAGKADSQPVLGWAITGIGAAFVVGGLLWHFLEPTGDKVAKTKMMPWTTGQASGVALGGSF
jgi:hypothetical protein